MLPLRTGVVAMTFGVCVLVLAGEIRGGNLGAQDSLLPVHTRRQAASDLEIRGVVKDGARFVSRASLLTLPQVEAVVKRDEDFTEVPVDGVKVRGVEFDVLLRALGAEPSNAVAVETVCSDGYTPTFPAEYVKQHRPILILTVEGLSPSAWAEKTHTGDLGPYFVAYADFKPAFHVLSHEDRPQVPVQMLRLEIAPQERMFGGITPTDAAKLAADSPVTQGFRIAQQNCFRCHNAAGYGGTKSPVSWKRLAKDARERPDWFAAWVHDPQSLDAKSEMPPNPKYDRDTLTALTRYFAAFSDQPTRGD